MTTTELLTRLADRHVLLCPAGDRLRFTPPNVIDDDLREELKRHKPAILSLIPPGWPGDVPIPAWWAELAGAFPAGFLKAAKRSECADPGCRFPVAVQWPGEVGLMWSCPACGLGVNLETC